VKVPLPPPSHYYPRRFTHRLKPDHDDETEQKCKQANKNFILSLGPVYGPYEEVAVVMQPTLTLSLLNGGSSLQ
jgi:hypothetical protein